MENNPEFIIQKWPHGWALCSPPDHDGVPIDAMSRVQPLVAKNLKTAVLDIGIAHYLNKHGHRAVMVFGQPGPLKEWRAVIEAWLDKKYAGNPERRWWMGMDVGSGSAAMFGVLAESALLRDEAHRYGNGSTPRDADDLGRCLRMLDAMPHFKERLTEVSLAYPKTKWPFIIANWSILLEADDANRSRILKEWNS